MLTTGLAASAQAQVPVTITQVAAEGTQFRVALSDGRVLRSPDLVGARLAIATPVGPITIRIDAVERDPDARTDDVWLHTLLVEQPDGTAVKATTLTGMSIDLSGNHGIQAADALPDQTFEAGWTAEGAV